MATLSDGSCALYLLIPCHEKATPIGLLDKYISFHGIEAYTEEADRQIVVLKEGGLFGFQAEDRPEHIFVDGKDCTERLVYEKGIWKVDTMTVGKTAISICWQKKEK